LKIRRYANPGPADSPAAGGMSYLGKHIKNVRTARRQPKIRRSVATQSVDASFSGMAAERLPRRRVGFIVIAMRL